MTDAQLTGKIDVMAASEFDTLRADLAGVRSDIDRRFGELRSEIDGRFARVDVRLERREAKIDEKPSAATIYQAALATFGGTFAVMIGTAILLKTVAITP